MDALVGSLLLLLLVVSIMLGLLEHLLLLLLLLRVLRSLLDLGLSLVNILLSTRLLLVSLSFSKLLLLLLISGLLIIISQDCRQNVLLSNIILDHSLLVLLLLLLKRLLLRSIHLGSLSIRCLQAELVMLLLLLLLLCLLLLLLLMLQEGLVSIDLLLFILNLGLKDLLLLSGSLLLLLRDDLGLLWWLLLEDLLSWRLGIFDYLSIWLWGSSCGSRLWFSLRLRLSWSRRVRSHWKLSGGLLSWLWMLSGRLRLRSLIQIGILVKDLIFEVLDARKVGMVDIIEVLRSGRWLIREIMLIWKSGITVILRLAFVFLEDCERVRKVKLGLFHVKVLEGVEQSHLLTVAGALNGFDSLGRIFVSWTEVLNFLIGDQSLFWLFAFLVKDTEIVPDLTLEGVK